MGECTYVCDKDHKDNCGPAIGCTDLMKRPEQLRRLRKPVCRGPGLHLRVVQKYRGQRRWDAGAGPRGGPVVGDSSVLDAGLGGGQGAWGDRRGRQGTRRRCPPPPATSGGRRRGTSALEGQGRQEERSWRSTPRGPGGPRASSGPACWRPRRAPSGHSGVGRRALRGRSGRRDLRRPDLRRALGGLVLGPRRGRGQAVLGVCADGADPGPGAPPAPAPGDADAGPAVAPGGRTPRQRRRPPWAMRPRPRPS